MLCHLYDTPTFKTKALRLVSYVQHVRILPFAAILATYLDLLWL